MLSMCFLYGDVLGYMEYHLYGGNYLLDLY